MPPIFRETPPRRVRPAAAPDYSAWVGVFKFLVVAFGYPVGSLIALWIFVRIVHFFWITEFFWF